MEKILSKIEKGLEPIYKGLPDLPKPSRDWLAKAAAVLAVIFGVLQLISAWDLWHAGHVANSIVNIANQVYGTSVVVNNTLGLFYWLSFAVILIEGIVLLTAYSGLKSRVKRGWDMLFLAALLNALYGIFVAFDNNYGGIGEFVLILIVTGIILYFLFQIRSYFPAPKKAKK